MLNKVILLGRLCANPELKTTPGGTTLAKLRLANNRRYKTKDGQDAEEVLYVDATAWGRTAETLCGSKDGRPFFSKGQRILIEGRLKLEQWEDKQTGGPRSKISINVDRWEFIETLKGSSGAPAAAARVAAPPPTPAPAGAPSTSLRF
jgi:single-strand DNA-binding protein